MNKLPLNQVLSGDCRKILREFPDKSINLVVTSPPYWGLRDYGEEVSVVWGGDSNCQHRWGASIDKNRTGGNSEKRQSRKGKDNFQAYESSSNYCLDCGAWYGQLGLEPHPQMYIDHISEIVSIIKRTLKADGSFWLNLGDTYCSTGGGPRGGNNNSSLGLKTQKAQRRGRYEGNLTNWLQPKQLLGIPWRVAMAIQNDGWILRNCIVWYKPNHMPESVGDRLTKSYEFIFFFVKQRYYHFDLDSIRKPYQTNAIDKMRNKSVEPFNNSYPGGHFSEGPRTEGHPLGKNPGDLWEVSTYPFPGAHFAVFPPKLIEPIIKAGSPKDGVVLDPFCGSGTTLRVARKLGRKFIGVEMNPKYVEISNHRARSDTYNPRPEYVSPLPGIMNKIAESTNKDAM